ncbi:MAG: hypothetical protein PHH28_00930 [Desulfuromonadaceae bacterium]|nr:hypothetical protein [Desulfuromonadaceae bacterium]
MGFMGFLTSAMATSSQRHLTYELGTGNIQQLMRVFNVCFGLHALLAIIIIILGETLGLWFLNSVLNVPAMRQDAAFWVFQFTIIASACYVMAAPFQALMTAHEQLGLVALIGIFNSLLIFSLALILGMCGGDRLKIYGFLSCAIAITITLIQFFLSRRLYAEAKLHLRNLYDSNIFKELASFSSWNLFGSLAVVSRSQGLAFLLNIYFGPLANAAFGIANQVYAAISQFTQAILQVVSPRLIKHEGAGNRDHMISLAVLICKYSFFIGCMWAIPLFAETPEIITYWLKNPPENSVEFCRIMILLYVCDQLSAGLSIPVQAIGKIARFQIVCSCIHLSTIPLAIVLLKVHGGESVVLLASLVTACINMLLRGYLLKVIAQFSYRGWFKKVVIRGFISVLPAIGTIYLLQYFMQPSFVRVVGVVSISIILNIICFSLFGLTNNERGHIFSILLSFKFVRKRICS